MPLPKRTIFLLLLVLFLSLTVRGLTAYFIHTHLSDPAWFQSGTYTVFDRQSQAILDGKASLFWIDDPLRTDAAVYPPGFPLWLALIYKLTGNRNAAEVQKIQWILDSLSVFLIVAIGITAFGYRAGLAAGVLAALAPLLALAGATPLADSPTSWLVLGAVLLFLIALKRQQSLAALAAGLLLGLSCWFRSNAVLLPLCWIISLCFWETVWRNRLTLGAAVLIGFAVVLAPLVIRNGVAFGVFTPTGLGAGTNLWEGIGETERAQEFGAVFGDAELIEKERAELGVSKNADFDLYYPDGVARDRERARKAFAVIRAHPIWYAGVMLRRMVGVLKYAGTPSGYYGSSGINVTPQKCLPSTMQGGVLSLLVRILGMLQSVLRYVALPLMVVGIVLAFRRDPRLTLFMLSTIVYYLVAGSALHTEYRYGLPMQALLFVFAGVTLSELIGVVRGSKQPS
jgi:4-amino-4-deoxy-L-arabinose transferase-like glycosyltransferase